MADRFARLRAIVEAAIDLPESDRAAWIHEACGGDTELEATAQELALGLLDDTFLGPAPSMTSADESLGPGSRLGSFVIRGVLGSGGMGTVFEAEQDAPRRTVALKVMTRNAVSGQGLERFRYEIEVLGALRHPGIAQIHDSGIHEDGHVRPWFAMEFVPDASTLLEHATQRALGLRARLKLFLDVCDAVQHGHQNGVIHRDLKPDNLLVDGDGRVKVIDFGVARVVDPDALQATMRTQAEEIVGTLAYMSPEQVAGKDVDTRGDVYSLGVVLYQLLSGALPIDVRKTDFLTSARRITEEAPTRPSQIKGELQGDLEAILLKSLDKEPAQRYESAAAFAADIRRHLAGEAITARPPSAFRQLRLLARRNKAVVAAGLIILVVSTTAAIVSLNHAARSRDAEEAAGLERDRFRALFESQFQEGIDTVLTHAPTIGQLYGGAPIATRLARGAIDRLDALTDSASNDPALTLKLARSYCELSLSLADPSNQAAESRKASAESATKALALVEQVRARAPETPGLDAAHARALAELANIDGREGRYDEAKKKVEGALASLARVPDTNVSVHGRVRYIASLAAFLVKDLEGSLAHLDTHIQLLEQTPEGTNADGAQRRFLCSGYLHRSEVQRLRRRFADAEADLRKAISILEALTTAYPERLPYKVSHAMAWRRLALIMMARGRRPEAHKFYARAHELADKLRVEAPNHLGVMWYYAMALMGLGQVETDKGVNDHPKGSPERIAHFKASIVIYDKAIAVYREIERQGRLDDRMARGLRRTQQQADFMRRIVARHADGSK